MSVELHPNLWLGRNNDFKITIVGKSFGMPTEDFDLEEVVSVINNYNKDKFKKKRIKLPNTIENRLYITIASCYKDEETSSCKYWYEKAYRNAVNDKELQNEILKELKILKI